MEKWSFAQKDLTLMWLNEQWSKPSRTDHYLMRVAQRVQQLSGNKQATLQGQMVKFEPAKPTEQIDRIERSKAIWKGGVQYAELVYKRQQRMNKDGN